MEFFCPCVSPQTKILRAWRFSEFLTQYRRQQMRFPGSNRLLTLLAIIVVAPLVWAQETTGGLQGTVKDSSGAVVAGAHVIVSGTTLVGKKELDTDVSGY